MISLSPRPRPRQNAVWSDRRILMLVALATIIVSSIWHLPQELNYLGERTGELLFALTLAMATTYILRPVVRWLTSLPAIGNTAKGRSKATIITFLGVLLALYVVFLVGFKPFENDMRELVSTMWPRTVEQREALISQWRASLQQTLEPYRIILPPAALDDPEYFTKQAGDLAAKAGSWLTHQTAHLGFIVELLLIPVLAFYFLADGQAIRREAKLLVPIGWRPRLARMAEHFDFVLDGYVRGQVWMCIIAWVLTTIALWCLGVPHAVTLGFIAGLTRAVPVVGPLLGAIPLLAVCLFYKGMQTAVFLGIGFTLMHFLESKVLLPKIVGHHVDLHPVSVIVSLLIGMEFFGFIGVFLAVPIAAVLKILLVEYHFAQEQKLAVEKGTAVPITDSPTLSTSSGLVTESAELQ
ncbi:AI-2E family transporter [bacterium]|nr:MAG: AI-2E family transporter [bacterium]